MRCPSIAENARTRSEESSPLLSCVLNNFWFQVINLARCTFLCIFLFLHLSLELSLGVFGVFENLRMILLVFQDVARKARERLGFVTANRARSRCKAGLLDAGG